VSPNQFLHYQLIERLGEGPLGETWQAYDPALERGVAVKILRPYSHGSDDLQHRYIILQERLRAREGAPAAAFDWTSDDDRQAIIRELVEGEPLGRRFQQGDLSYQGVLSLLARLVRSVKVIHDCEMVHGNLHPWNVILGPQGNPILTDPLLPDIARQWVAAVPSNRRVFVAPEVIAGRTPNRRSDIFSLGAIAIYLFAGERLIQTPDIRLEKVAESFASAADTDLTVMLDIPNEARLLFSVMLAEDPKERFTDIDGLVATLDQVRNQARESVAVIGKKTNPRTYLMLSVLTVLLIILWIVITSVKK
jgi:serine/threonine-protein kinase